MDPHNFGESILLAVSGGVDSLVMAHLLARKWRDAYGDAAHIALAHCNFHLRGGESDADQAHVLEFAAALGLECFVEHFDTRGFAQEHGVSIEMAARELRYRWFDELCKEKGFPGVCVAHNANDNAETLLLNLVRGTGLRGICGMGQRAVNPYGTTLVFRPLLGFSRSEIEAYAREKGISWRTDSSNLSDEYKRNLIRNKVLPLLEVLNPGLLGTLAADMRHFAQAQEIVDDFTEQEMGRLDGRSEAGGRDPGEAGAGGEAGASGEAVLRMSIKALTDRPHWEYLLYELLSKYGFSSVVCGEAADLLGSDRIIGGKVFHGQGYTLVTTAKEIRVFPSGEEICDDAGALGCNGDGPAGVTVELIDWAGDKGAERTQRGVIMMDADKLATRTPILRKWQAGDYLYPIGMRGRKKVSDLLKELGYDVISKAEVLVVTGPDGRGNGADSAGPDGGGRGRDSGEPGGHHVLAVVGERIDSYVRITASTKKVWRILRK